jgi:hypothetical protein
MDIQEELEDRKGIARDVIPKKDIHAEFEDTK